MLPGSSAVWYFSGVGKGKLLCRLLCGWVAVFIAVYGQRLCYDGSIGPGDRRRGVFSVAGQAVASAGTPQKPAKGGSGTGSPHPALYQPADEGHGGDLRYGRRSPGRSGAKGADRERYGAAV